MSDFRKHASQYIQRLVVDTSRVCPVSHKHLEPVMVEFGSFFNWGTVGDKEALYFRETLTKKKRVIVDCPGAKDGEFEESNVKEFKPYPVDFYEFFDTKMGGVQSGMVVVLSRGKRGGRPAVHAVNVAYDQQCVWTQSADWPLEFKVESHGIDDQYVAESFPTRFAKWVDNKMKI